MKFSGNKTKLRYFIFSVMGPLPLKHLELMAYILKKINITTHPSYRIYRFRIIRYKLLQIEISRMHGRKKAPRLIEMFATGFDFELLISLVTT